MTSTPPITNPSRFRSVRSRTLTGVRLAVVGINYAPETTGIAPYTTNLCEFLAGEGAEVTAIVGMPHYPAWQVDPLYRGRLRADDVLNGVRIIRAGHYVPSKQSAVRRGLYEGSFLLTSGLASRSLRPDAVIAVSPALSALRTARALARRCDVPFGAVIQDLMGRAAEQSGMSGGSRVARAVGRAEMSSLRQADQIAVISSTFAGALVAEGIPSERISLMPNYSHIRSTAATRTDARIQLGWDQSHFVVLHTGNMGLKQDLGNVVETARLAVASGRTDLRFVLLGDGSQRQELLRQAVDLDNIIFLDSVTDDMYPIALAASDVLLVNERSTCLDMSLPSKLTSYLSSGRPVLAAVPAGGSTFRELARSGAARIVEPGLPQRLLVGVIELRDDAQACLELGSLGKAYATANLSTSVARSTALRFANDLLGRPNIEPEHRSAAQTVPTALAAAEAEKVEVTG